MNVIQFAGLVFDVVQHDFVDEPNENCIFSSFDAAYNFREQELDGVGSVAVMKVEPGVVILEC